ncbi:hypothetical protein JCM8097_004914 [Rhodosporidiobolus ruineniae]
MLESTTSACKSDPPPPRALATLARSPVCDDIPLCLCFTCGCDNQLSPSGGDGHAHICPRCNNGSVQAMKDRQCFTFCFVPLIPMGSQQIWYCTICQWRASQSGPAPPIAGQGGGFYGAQPSYGGGGYGPPQGQMMYPQQPGYAAPQGYGR